jgi:hypothetical protein
MVYVTLTEKGLCAARQVSTTRHEPITAALSEVTPENRGIIGRFLRQFNTELNRRSTVTEGAKSIGAALATAETACFHNEAGRHS